MTRRVREMPPSFQRTLFSVFARVSSSLTGVATKFPTLRKIPGARALGSAGYYMLNELIWLLPSKSIIEIQGSKMYVNVHHRDPSMRRTFRAYALRRVHEESTTELFKKVVKEGDVVVDLGANLGYFTLLAARLVGKRGKVYSFEAEPTNYNYLLKNITLNGYDNVFAVPKAVSDKTGKVKLYICPYDSGHHTINQYGGIEAYKPGFGGDRRDFVEVETVTLDEFFEGTKQPINVVKMDVEGAEMLALSGMDRVVRQSENLKMFLEFFPLLIREMGGSPEEFIRRLLEDYHFSVSVIGHDYSMRQRAPDEDRLQIRTVEELMNLCKGRTDHVNLFLERKQ